jgi:hypothetical protein
MKQSLYFRGETRVMRKYTKGRNETVSLYEISCIVTTNNLRESIAK